MLLSATSSGLPRHSLSVPSITRSFLRRTSAQFSRSRLCTSVLILEYLRHARKSERPQRARRDEQWVEKERGEHVRHPDLFQSERSQAKAEEPSTCGPLFVTSGLPHAEVRLLPGKQEHERGTHACLAICSYGAPVGLGDLTGDGETEAYPILGSGGVPPVEALEDEGQLVLGDPDPRIGDR